jgi:hypothetical protein
MTGPLKPKDVQKRKDAALPEEVFQVFNDLIQEGWNETWAVVQQNEAATRIAKALGITKAQAFQRKLLDVESAYRKAGWKVEYDKPGYCETYEATFRFSK